MEELSVLAQATIVLALALTAARLAQRAPAATRALLVASAFAVLSLLPVAALTVPKRTIEIAVPEASSTPFIRDDAVTGAPARSTEEAGQPIPPSWRIPVPPLSTTLRVAWAVGVFFVLTRLGLALVRLRVMRRSGLPWPDGQALVHAIAGETGVGRRPNVFLHEGLSAPVTCGILRPSVGLPVDAPEWTAAELRRALIHELEHVRRGDWVVQLLARCVCALYWFHPLVWMAWRRLCVESERACDDAVLGAEERTAYAEQLVSLARRLKASPAPLLSMADRSDLAVRVHAVLDAAQARGPVRAAGVLSIACAAAVLTAVISPLQATRAAAAQGPSEERQLGLRLEAARGPVEVFVVESAQQPSPDDGVPASPNPQASTVAPDAFEVVSIRRNRSTDPSRGRIEPGGRFTAINLPVAQIIGQAYGVRPFQVLNAPDWTATERFDIVAKAPEGVPFGPERVALFLRALLRDRFAFEARTETHDMPIYALVSRAGRQPGRQLEASAVDCTAPVTARPPGGGGGDRPPCALIGTLTGGNNRRYEMRGYPMSRFADMLSGAVGRVVEDRTGLAGTWNVEIDFSADSTSPGPDDRPSIFTALQEQLGLALEPARGPVDMLVIARVERPTED